MEPSDSYRPAARALRFGLVALALRAAAVGIVFLMEPMESPSQGWGFDDSDQSFNLALGICYSLTDFTGTCLGLVGVGYSAIAAHRREWGVVLVLAWVVSVPAAVVNQFLVAEFIFPVG